ncbi:MAG: polysaccharide deacetylase family protein [Bacteroidota bacterium]
MFYLSKIPWFIKKVYPSCIWSMPLKEKKTIYLTFDDGPHPIATPFVLNELSKYNAKATFFCIGDNVTQFPEIYNSVLQAGHSIGNHTFNHLNGGKTKTVDYINNISKAGEVINSKLFRPPYGRITAAQIRALKKKLPIYKIIMWNVLSGDFDTTISVEKCWRNVEENLSDGSIVVFHDSEKAFRNLEYVLPKVLENFSQKGYSFEKL